MPDLVGIDPPGFIMKPYGQDEHCAEPTVAPRCEQCHIRLTRDMQGFDVYCRRCCPDVRAYKEMDCGMD